MKKKKKKNLGANWMGYCPNYVVRGENSSELGYCIFRSSRKATGGFEKKKKKRRSQDCFEVATSI